MKLLDKLRIGIGRRPKLPPGTTYQAEVVYGSSLLRVGGVPGYVVRAYPPGSDPDLPGEQVGPRFETFDRATAYRAWLSGEAETFTWGEGAA